MGLLSLDIQRPAFSQSDDSSLKYHRLLDRAMARDSSLTLADYENLYRNYVKHPGYKPGHQKARLAELDSALTKRKFSEAANIGEALFKEAPFMLGVALTMYTCYSELGQYSKARSYQRHFQNLLTVICNTGDGSSASEALFLLYQEDEPYLLDYLSLSPKERKVVDGRFAVYTLESPNERGLKKIFFDIENPLSYYVVKE
ncbi:DUF4919 domain-containing protein [Roseivirga sp. BDSF3-8]|uniref:DUF4919 domain-containing protein n=1 Tax=Roseivirga sp. BDSF3-8 TaxID=3241598 RepID=UPI0035319DA7